MTRAFSRWLAIAPLLLVGCRDRKTAALEQDLSSEALAELAELTKHISGRWVLQAALIVTITVLLRRWVDLAIRVTWRLGWDRQQRMARGRSVLDFTFALVATLLVVRPFFSKAPLLASIVSAIAALVIAIALPSWIQDFAGGIELATRRTFREGDQITVGDMEGTVRSIGLFRTRLRHGDGSSVTLPNRLVAGSAVRVGRDTGAVPVSVALPKTVGDDPAKRAQIESLAMVSPYRRSGSKPQLRQTSDGWALVVQTWATRDTGVVQRALEHQVGRYLEHLDRSSARETPREEPPT